jgi:hypothetical protein
MASIAAPFVTTLANASALAANSGAYRPPQWTNPPMVSITVPASTTSVVTSTQFENAGAPITDTTPLQTGSAVTNTAAPTIYVFDAVLDLEHEQRLEKTRHPIQTGADVSSHAYLMPARVVLNVLMSDVVGSFTPGNFTGNPSKSVSAYLTMLNIQATRMPLTVTTRLRTYFNMMIAGISPREDYKTITGLRMRVELEQILTASTSTVPSSARPNDTNSTGLGAVSPTPQPAQGVVSPSPTVTAAGTTPTTPNVTQAPASGANSSLVNQFGFPQVGMSSTMLPTNSMFTDMTVSVPGAGTISSQAGQQSLPGMANLLAM